MMNVYKKQMTRLGITPKQYANIIGVPYEVVKVYLKGENREDMPLKNYFDKVMMSKREEIEKDVEGTKAKMLEEKLNSGNINYWYENEYDYKEFIKKVGSFNKLYERYDFDNFGRYSVYYVVSKTKKKHIKEKNKNAIIEILYDIYNDKKSHLKTKNVNVGLKTKTVNVELKEWYKTFELRDYVESKGYTLNSFAKKYNLAIGSCYNVLHKSKNVSASTLRKVYNAVQRCDTDNNNIENKDLKECHTQQEEVKVNINNKDLELLRALLVESLNDRDKALIRLFGGKIND